MHTSRIAVPFFFSFSFKTGSHFTVWTSNSWKSFLSLLSAGIFNLQDFQILSFWEMLWGFLKSPSAHLSSLVSCHSLIVSGSAVGGCSGSPTHPTCPIFGLSSFCAFIYLISTLLLSVLGMVTHTGNPSTGGSEVGGCLVWAFLGYIVNTCLKTATTKIQQWH